jgi:tetratricopeptide (TPR) repeat protein
MIGQQILHYRILRQLGSGGMGVVYEAEDTRLGRHVAMKFLPQSLHVEPEAIERFEREARIASSLNHPNICTIHDIGVHDGRQFIVMELLEGESLRSRVNGHPMPLDSILDTGCQIADALDAAHAKGVIHRDIKPANVFVTKRGQAKLVDFGIAKLGGDRHEHDATAETRVAGDVLTVPGMAVGSVNYMSPEQARGEELDGRTDLFSLGLVLYEMSTGRQAFVGPTTAVVFDAILNRQPPEPRQMNPQIPEELQRVIMRSLEKDRRLRFQSAADMLAELSRIRRDTSGWTAGVPLATEAPPAAPAPATAAGTAPVPAVAPSRARRPWVAIAALAVVALGIGGYFLWKANQAPALTERDTVVIADFANTTGDPVFDDALRQAVSVQLQQSPFLTLLPDQRVRQTMRLMQRPENEAVIGPVAREVCIRSGAKASVEGSIAALGSSYVINLGVYNCQSGAALAQEQAQAASKELVLAELGKAVTNLRGRLGESLASIQKYDVPVTDATTSSLQALRAYGQALRVRATKGDPASIPFFLQAIEKDPNFALAYAKLAVVFGNIGQSDDAKKNALKAYELRDRVSEYERLYINYNHAARVLRDQKKVRESLELLTAAYPRDYAGRNNLGVYFNGQGQFEEAIKHYQAAMEIAPDEPQPRSNAAYVLMMLGRNEEAYALIERTLAMRPDSGLAIARWGQAVRTNDPRAAQFEQVAVKIGNEDLVLQQRASLAIWHGQLSAYDKYVDQLRAKARAAKSPDGVTALDIGQAITHATYLRGTHVDALKALLAKVPQLPARAQIAMTLASLGDTGPGRSLLPLLKKEAGSTDVIRFPATILEAYVKTADGQPREAIGMVEAVITEVPRAQDLHFVIGQLRAASGDLDGAIASYQAVVKAAPALGANPIVGNARLHCAELYLKQGKHAQAGAELDALLDQWKQGDADFPPLVKAKDLRAKAGK